MYFFNPVKGNKTKDHRGILILKSNIRFLFLFSNTVYVSHYVIELFISFFSCDPFFPEFWFWWQTGCQLRLFHGVGLNSQNRDCWILKLQIVNTHCFLSQYTISFWLGYYFLFIFVYLCMATKSCFDILKKNINRKLEKKYWWTSSLIFNKCWQCCASLGTISDGCFSENIFWNWFSVYQKIKSGIMGWRENYIGSGRNCLYLIHYSPSL